LPIGSEPAAFGRKFADTILISPASDADHPTRNEICVTESPEEGQEVLARLLHPVAREIPTFPSFLAELDWPLSGK
jgi:hypothetical protein